jgi:fibronectin type 3 domain-containing protein
MYKIICFSVLLVSLPGVCQAQKPLLLPTAHGSSKGILVTVNDPELLGKEIGVYRKGKTEADFQKIATLSPPRSIDDVRQRIASAQSVFAPYAQPSDKNLVQLWSSYQKNPAPLSTFVTVIPQLAYVFSLAYWDTNVRAGQSYQYQIRTGQKPVATSTAYLYTGKFSFPALQLVQDTALQKQIRLDFLYSATLIYYVDLEVKRKLFTDQNNAYRSEPVLVTTTQHNKKRYVSVTDTSLKQYGSYHYQIRQRSIFGQTDTATMYVTASNVGPQLLPSLLHLAAVPEKQQRALRVGWRFSNPSLIENAALYRSTDPQGNFTLVGNFSPADTSASNVVQQANELYFYYLEFTDLFGNKQKSSIIHGSYTGNSVPAPPHELQYSFGPKQIRLQWKPSDPITRGYYVYRRQGIEGEFLQISRFVPRSVVSYTDTSVLQAAYTYYYAVKAESDTYEKSAYSDTVAVRPVSDIRTELKPPTDVAATYRDGHVMLAWEDMHLQNPQVVGYQVFRKKESETNYVPLTPQSLSVGHNYFVDSTAAAVTYQYTIVSTDAGGQQSKPGIPVTVETASYARLVPERLGFEKLATGVKLKWTSLDIPYIKEIRIYRAEDNQPFQLRSTSRATAQSFADNTARKGHMYSYRLTTVDGQGKESRPSSIVSVEL